MYQQFNLLPVLTALQSISSIIVVDLDDAERIIGLIDQWNGKPLPVRYGASFLRTANAKVCRWLIKVPNG